MSTYRMYAADLGASGGKCFAGILQDGEFKMEEIHRFEHDGISFFMPDRAGTVSERTYWDVPYIYRNIVEGLQAYRRTVSDQLDSIAVDTWGADGALFSADGDMLGQMYCYRDHRLDPMIDAVKSRMDPDRIYEITGIHFQTFNLSNQLHWLVTNRPELLLEGAHYIPVPTLFPYLMGGSRSVDSSWASVTQLMQAGTLEWSGEILSALGIPAEIMPAIVEPGTCVGTLRPELASAARLPEAKLIASAAHDTASAYAAAPVDNYEEALIISSGTWSLVGKLIDAPITNKAAMEAGISNEGGIGNIRFLKNVMGTWLIQELRRNWAIEDGVTMDFLTLTNMASESPAFVSLIDPDDARLYNPTNMGSAISECCRDLGEPVPQSRGALLRCVYESLALKYRYVNDQICRVSGTSTSAVNVVGGGSQNKLLAQFTANALGVPMHAGPVEATAVGNFMVQALGLGAIASIEDAQPIIRQAFPIITYQPENTAAWNDVYPRFIDLCERNS